MRYIITYGLLVLQIIQRLLHFMKSPECIWLKSIIQHIREKYDLSTIKDSLTVLDEDNAACITQIRGCYIKGDRTKYISLKFFYTRALEEW